MIFENRMFFFNAVLYTVVHIFGIGDDVYLSTRVREKTWNWIRELRAVDKKNLIFSLALIGVHPSCHLLFSRVFLFCQGKDIFDSQGNFISVISIFLCKVCTIRLSVIHPV